MTLARPPVVLLVDDSVDAVDVAADAFVERGCAVLLAFDGEAALAVAREQLPDVVVLDLAMPRLDGLATARRLRADARTASIPLVLFSAHVGLEVEAAARAAGFDVVVRKPGPLSRLVAAVVGLLQGPTDDTVAVVDVLAAVVGP